MGLESAVEYAIRTECKAVTDLLDDSPVYRTFWLDDETADEYEDKVYPYVSVKADPFVPASYKSIFKDIGVSIRMATHIDHDKKRESLKLIYEAVRGIIDTDAYSVSGAAKKSTLIVEGVSDVDENENYAEIVCIVKLCSE